MINYIRGFTFDLETLELLRNRDKAFHASILGVDAEFGVICINGTGVDYISCLENALTELRKVHNKYIGAGYQGNF